MDSVFLWVVCHYGQLCHMDSYVIWIENDTLCCNGGGVGGQRPPTQATAYHQDSTTDGAGGVMGGVGGATPPHPDRLPITSPQQK